MKPGVSRRPKRWLRAAVTNSTAEKQAVPLDQAAPFAVCRSMWAVIQSPLRIPRALHSRSACGGQNALLPQSNEARRDTFAAALMSPPAYRSQREQKLSCPPGPICRQSVAVELLPEL